MTKRDRDNSEDEISEDENNNDAISEDENNTKQHGGIQTYFSDDEIFNNGRSSRSQSRKHVKRSRSLSGGSSRSLNSTGVGQALSSYQPQPVSSKSLGSSTGKRLSLPILFNPQAAVIRAKSRSGDQNPNSNLKLGMPGTGKRSTNLQTPTTRRSNPLISKTANVSRQVGNVYSKSPSSLAMIPLHKLLPPTLPKTLPKKSSNVPQSDFPQQLPQIHPSQIKPQKNSSLNVTPNSTPPSSPRTSLSSSPRTSFSSNTSNTSRASSITEPPIDINKKPKKRRYIDENKEVHKFEAKYMQNSSIGDVKQDDFNGEKEYRFENHLDKLSKFLSDDFEFLKIPDLQKALDRFIYIRKVDLNKFSDIPNIQNNEYMTQIREAISKEPKHKVTIFQHKLYLFNIDMNIKNFIESFHFTQPEHLDKQYETFIYDVIGFFHGHEIDNLGKGDNTQNSIKDLYKIFNVKYVNLDIAENTRPYMEMFIPKLTKDVNLTGVTLTNTNLGGENNLGGGGNNTKDVELIDLNANNFNPNELNNIDEAFSNNHWENVINNKRTMYGFNSTHGFTNGESVNLSDKKVQDYFDKCNDLQLFYINKHIEIYELFREIIGLINTNLSINGIILKLLDPQLVPLKDDSFVFLKNMITDIDVLNKGQKSMLNAFKDDREEREERERQIIQNMGRVGGGGYNSEENLHNGGSRRETPVLAPIQQPDYKLTLTSIDNDNLNLLNGSLLSDFKPSDDKKNSESDNIYQYQDENDKTKYVGCNLKNFLELLIFHGKSCKIVFGSKLQYFNDYYFINNDNDNTNGKFTITDNNNQIPINFNITSINYREKSITIEFIKNSVANYTNSMIISAIESLLPGNISIDIPNFKRHIITFTNAKKYFKDLKDSQIVFGRISDTDIDNDLMMTYYDKNNNTGADDGVFVNILIGIDDGFTNFKIGTPKLTKITDVIVEWNDILADRKSPSKFMFVDFFIDDLESYRTLQLIKRIQLTNDESLHWILKPKQGQTLQETIAEYKKNIPYHDNLNPLNKPKKFKEKEPTPNPDNRWKTFETTDPADFTNNNLYFDKNIKQPNGNSFEEISVVESDKAQQTIYKCYDLQILYLIKHLELVELFKFMFYFLDMLFKKVAVLLFVLALYKKKAYDFDKNQILKIKKILTNTKTLVSNEQKIIGKLASPEAIITGGSQQVINPPSGFTGISGFTHIYDTNPGSKQTRNEKIKALRNELKDAQSLTPTSNRDKEDKKNKLAKVKLDAEMFELSEKKTNISSKQEKMQLIGTLSNIDSKFGEEITKDFINVGKHYDTLHSDLSVLPTSVNPQKNAIIKAFNELEKAKHKLGQEECKGGVCTLEERIDQLERIMKAQLEYFKAAGLCYDITGDKIYKYVINEALRVNSNYTNTNLTNLEYIKSLRLTIEILSIAQDVYKSDIDIVYYLEKAKYDYDKNPDDQYKQGLYADQYFKYLELLKNLVSRLKSKYLNQIITIDTTEKELHKLKLEAVKSINNFQNNNKTQKSKIYNIIFNTLTESLTLLGQQQSIDEYKKYIKLTQGLIAIDLSGLGRLEKHILLLDNQWKTQINLDTTNMDDVSIETYKTALLQITTDNVNANANYLSRTKEIQTKIKELLR